MIAWFAWCANATEKKNRRSSPQQTKQQGQASETDREYTLTYSLPIGKCKPVESGNWDIGAIFTYPNVCGDFAAQFFPDIPWVVLFSNFVRQRNSNKDTLLRRQVDIDWDADIVTPT
jgi:hypothetical protein